MKKKYDFYQEEFDKETRHEMNEWARLVDRYAAELKKYEGAVLQDSQMLVIDPNTAASNQRADEFLQNNAQLAETVKELYELC